MIKNRKKMNDPELQKMEEEYEAMLKEFEEDKKQHDFSIPKEWDQNFRAVMDEVLENKEKEKNKRRSKLAIAAGVILAVTVGSTYATETVEGNKLLDIFGKNTKTQAERFEMYGTEEEFDSEVGSEDVISFTANNLDELYTDIRTEMKRPIFQVSSYLEDYEIKLAEYDKDFNMVNVQIELQDGWIYVTQEERLEDGGLGRQSDEEVCARVNNLNLQKEIIIYKGKNAEFYNFTIQIGKDIVYIQSMSSLERCKELAENFIYE